MFNLLPDNFKEKLKTEYKWRRLIVGVAVIVFLQISFLIFIFPTWIVSFSKEKEISTNIDGINKSLSSSDVSPIASIITSTNIKLNILNTSMQYPEVLPLLNTIISNKIPYIHINQFLYQLVDKSNATISLGGVADTRDSLVAFVKNLQSSGAFKTVDLPVSNLTKDKDIVFSINIEVSD